MFYIKTADTLTRTATWLNKMDGGISYLKNLIVNDSLGICQSLEEEIAELITHYTCEWKEVVDNQNLKKKFNHFVNAPDEKDPSIKFEPLREQKQAAAW